MSKKTWIYLVIGCVAGYLLLKKTGKLGELGWGGHHGGHHHGGHHGGGFSPNMWSYGPAYYEPLMIMQTDPCVVYDPVLGPYNACANVAAGGTVVE